MKNTSLICLFIFAFGHQVTAQQNVEQMIDSLIEIGTAYVGRPDSLEIYANKAYALSNEHQYKKGQAFAAKMMGISSFYQSDFDLAIRYYEESLDLQSRLGDSLEVAKAYYNIAMTYNSKADQTNTMKNAMEAIRIFDALKNYNGSGRVYNLIGIAASRHKEYPKAAEYFKSYLENAILAGDSLEIATSMNNLGSTYTELQETDSALHYLYKAVDLHIAIGAERNVAGTYENIATLLERQGKIDEAIVNLEKALAISVAQNNAYREASGSYNLGRIYRKKDDNQKALSLVGRSLELSRQIGDNFQLAHSLEQMAYIKSDLGQYREAYDYLSEANIYRDSIFDVELARSNEELKTIYETEKKEQEIKSLSQENLIKSLQLRQRNTWLLIVLSALILLTLGAWLRIRNRNLRAEAKLQRELARKQEEATLGILHAEERERGRIAADLHDGVGQLLSAALLNLNQVNKSITEGESPNREAMQNALALLKNSYDEMREISHQMMPNALLKAGLGYSIREFLNKVNNENLKINLDVVGLNERLDEQAEISLYRCVQESVNNVIKHAGADRLSIQLVKDEDGISVSVEDNGKGFDMTKHTLHEGIGLKNIRSRVTLLKGTLDVDSIPGKGTLLLIYIPLKSK